MYAHRPATLLDEQDEMEGGMLAGPSPVIPKPGEEAVRLLGEGGAWWGEGSSYPGMEEGLIPPLSRRQSSMWMILCCQKLMLLRHWGKDRGSLCSSAMSGRSDNVSHDM